MGWVALPLVVISGVVVRADEVRFGKEVLYKVVIRNFDGEFIVLDKGGGVTVAKKLADVTTMTVDSIAGLEDFNQAEHLFQQGQYAEAAKKYKTALPKSRDFWKSLIQVRQMQAYDRFGALDRATELYVPLVSVFPAKAEVLMPTQIDKAPPDIQRRALEVLREAIGKTKDQAVYWQLEAFRLTILEQSQLEDADKVAREILSKLQKEQKEGNKAQEASSYRLQMIAIRVEVKHEQYEVALGHVDQALAEAPEDFMPELLYLKGRCLLAGAKTREDYIRTGLALMRVVIHYPKSRFCAPSLYYAAVVHEKIDRSQKAAELYKACLELPGADDKLREQANNAMGRLKQK